MKLLLIDDDEIDRQLVCRLLRGSHMPMDIVQASTARSGLQLFEEMRFDAVLLDVLLPDVNGLEVLDLIQRRPEVRAAVIMLTGATDETMEIRCLEAGAQDFLLKGEVSARHLQRALLHARTRHSLEVKLIESRESLRVLAEQDPLTGLGNRYFFDQSLRLVLARANQEGGKVALTLLDLDNFKVINDSMGHDSGDLILAAAARRLLEVAPPGDLVCRLGGDEFAIITQTVETELSLAKLAEDLLAAMRAPFHIHGTGLVVQCSIGIAISPDCGDTVDQLLKSADLAMYQAKREGRDRFQFFSAKLQADATRKASLANDMRTPDFLGQLRLFYQPLVDARSRRICGAEALVRWQHPTLGMLMPADFIVVAEEFGRMNIIDSWSRRQASLQMADWLRRAVVGEGFSMKFNVCAQTLKDECLSCAILSDLDSAGVPGACMEMEVTESLLIASFQTVSPMLNDIRAHGLRIAIDDFGTGYSSLAYLSKIPTSTIKVDRSFLANVPQSETDCRVLRSMIVMVKSLELRVVVEGVETREQADVCSTYGADMLQGYLFSPPVPRDEFERMLTARPQLALS
ncbi:putative bifunctional diguanylate cyclase/phosphodiesterase [Azorhizobium doebereinerae]|uniref:putative bifunctional diguanylate cyclase/phosphodiesterase n=1 Tax=Azorhizobium doebereinerae TaxID=281091 RepID=UPI00048A69D2|nr:GGDEF domain-containing response regulator [Azorhizobium doebereinerae]